MKLADWIAEEGTSATALAQEAGVSVSTITRAANGEVMPRDDLIRWLFVRSGGKVTPNDFFGIDTPPPFSEGGDGSHSPAEAA